eukprot:1449759-Pleurochrysis_carterae.AAC.1
MPVVAPFPACETSLFIATRPGDELHLLLHAHVRIRKGVNRRDPEDERDCEDDDCAEDVADFRDDGRDLNAPRVEALEDGPEGDWLALVEEEAVGDQSGARDV